MAKRLHAVPTPARSTARHHRPANTLDAVLAEGAAKTAADKGILPHLTGRHHYSGAPLAMRMLTNARRNPQSGWNRTGGDAA